MKVAIVLILLGSSLTQSPQTWATTWTSSFSEVLKFPGKPQGSTIGTWWYDWGNKLFRIDRQNGALDRYCGTTKPYANTPCTQIVTGGWRYLYFPEIKLCCKCCADANGCGVVMPTWMSTGVYKGLQTLPDGTQTKEYLVQGVGTNYYYETAQAPVVPKRIVQETLSDMTFQQATYSSAPIPASTFALPSGIDCSSFCPTQSVCTQVRNQSTVKAATE